jgi:transposase
MDRTSLAPLDKETLIGLILAQSETIVASTRQIELLTKRVAELKAKLGLPPKTPNNSSIPPSAGQKPNLPKRESKRRKGRPGITRALAANPDRVIEATAEQCPHCAASLCEADQLDVHAYDHIDLPPIKPITPASTSIAASAPAVPVASRHRHLKLWSRARPSGRPSRRC